VLVVLVVIGGGDGLANPSHRSVRVVWQSVTRFFRDPFPARFWRLFCRPPQAMRYPPNAFRTNNGEDAVVEDVDVDDVVEVADSEEED
jgi:hypothetical protein